MISSLKHLPLFKGIGYHFDTKTNAKIIWRKIYPGEEKGSISVLFTDVNNDGHAFWYHKDY